MQEHRSSLLCLQEAALFDVPVIFCVRFNRLRVIMASKRFKRCVPLCVHFLTEDETHDLSFFGEQSMCVRLFKEAAARIPSVSCQAFLKDDGNLASVPYSLGPMAAETAWRIRLWGSQVKLAERYGTGIPYSHSSPTISGVLWTASSGVTEYVVMTQSEYVGEAKTVNDAASFYTPAYEELLEPCHSQFEFGLGGRQTGNCSRES